MKKLLSIAAATLLVGGLVSVPAFAQTSPAQPAAPAQQSAPAGKPAAKHHATKHMAAAKHHAARHKMSCYDHAWQSQAMKDCLAKGETKPGAKKAMKKMPTKAKKPMGQKSAS